MNKSAKETPLLPYPREANVLMLSHSVVTRNDMLLDYLGIYSFRYLTGFTVNHTQRSSLPILSFFTHFKGSLHVQASHVHRKNWGSRVKVGVDSFAGF